jgi:hypothetical protein
MEINLPNGDYQLETIVPIEIYDYLSDRWIKFPLQASGPVRMRLRVLGTMQINIIKLK